MVEYEKNCSMNKLENREIFMHCLAMDSYVCGINTSPKRILNRSYNTFRAINTFLSSSGTPILREAKSLTNLKMHDAILVCWGENVTTHSKTYPNF